MKSCRRINIAHDPGFDKTHFGHQIYPWEAKWIAGKDWDGESPIVWAFRRKFEVADKSVIRIHATADQRYDLYLNGERIGWGSERGNHQNWFYESYELTLTKGSHTLVARVWWTGHDKMSHYGHVTARPAFLLHAEDAWSHILDTGVAEWQVCELKGYSFAYPGIEGAFWSIGGRTVLDSNKHLWGFEKGEGDRWKETRIIAPASFRAAGDEHPVQWTLRPSILPPMFEHTHSPGIVRYVKKFNPEVDLETVKIETKSNDAEETAAWQAMLQGTGRVKIPANTGLRVLIDFDNYFCAWPQFYFSRGYGAEVRLNWTESLFDNEVGFDKGNRDEVDGKFFRGMSDCVVCDGEENRCFEPLWWEAGRYMQIEIRTDGQPLTVEGLALRETHYPHDFKSRFSCSDERWNDIFRLSQRVLEMCSHETYMDCPYYEQLMYVGDTRLEVLVTYATTEDDRLPRKAIEMFDRSRSESGLTMSRTPSRIKQVIPPFSLWWVQMVYDFSMWRDDPDFVRKRMPGVRAVLEAFRECVDASGLLVAPLGWNFLDWVPGWNSGMPPSAVHGKSATHNLHLVWTLKLAAELEEQVGEPLLARRNRETAQKIIEACKKTFWNDEKNLFAEDVGHTLYTEHAQCMATLGSCLSDKEQQAMTKALLSVPDLSRTTVYYSHYLFETFYKLKLPEEIYRRLQLWFELPERGLRTVVESPEPTRSDCHAWGAHPMYHAFASFCGIRPASPGFKKIKIAPQPGMLDSLNTKMVHPDGWIEVDLHSDGKGWSGSVSTPPSVPSQLVLPDGRELSWDGGKIEV
ncbi:MAG: alpha-L-rhamnosidase [Lentisphaerae bacterium]|jgi:alpha-L-rhamnosidase|nr:alpha-L-rhamnosidase [Lentisphaerota bacterium]